MTFRLRRAGTIPIVPARLCRSPRAQKKSAAAVSTCAEKAAATPKPARAVDKTDVTASQADYDALKDAVNSSIYNDGSSRTMTGNTNLSAMNNDARVDYKF